MNTPTFTAPIAAATSVQGVSERVGDTVAQHGFDLRLPSLDTCLDRGVANPVPCLSP
jgi:hypothetical protein